jgi:hypothetical protein
MLVVRDPVLEVVGVVGLAQRDAASRVFKRKTAHVVETEEDDDAPIEHIAKRYKARTNWSSGEPHRLLQQSMDLVAKNGHSVRTAARLSGVPFTVLANRVNGKLSIDAHAGLSSSLTAAQEQQLVHCIIETAERGFGKDVMEIRDIAQRMSTNPHFKATQMWWQRFKQRHPELARRRAQGFERLRAMAMNPSLIKQLPRDDVPRCVRVSFGLYCPAFLHCEGVASTP